MNTDIALIMAAGSGTRAGGGIPKQFRMLAGRPVIWHSMRAFTRACPGIRIVVVTSPTGAQMLRGLMDRLPAAERIDFETVPGGDTRLASVASALRYVGDGCGLVAVHDAARPLVSEEMIVRGMDTARRLGSAVPVVPPADSIRCLDSDGQSRAVDRSRYRLVQTPQIFPLTDLGKAYSGVTPDDSLTDDASVYEKYYNRHVNLYQGDTANRKITMPEDFIIAESLLQCKG